jgi:hypothetical protein
MTKKKQIVQYSMHSNSSGFSRTGTVARDVASRNMTSYAKEKERCDVPFGPASVAGAFLRLRAVPGDVSLEDEV